MKLHFRYWRISALAFVTILILGLQSRSAGKALGGHPQAQASDASAKGASNPKHTGEPISLNLRDVDLKDFFRLIHEISGLNIVLDPNISGTVTVVLDEVPWDQALEIVLRNNGLGKTVEDNVLRIAKAETLIAEQEKAAKLQSAREDAAPLVTVFRPLSYANAHAVEALLKAWAGGGALSRRGTVLVDERTNRLIISDIASQIPVIEDIVKKLDKKTKQVSIEARVMRVTTEFQRTLGVALSTFLRNPSGSTQAAGGTGRGTIGNTINDPTGQTIPVNPTTSGPFVFPNKISDFGVWVISNASSKYALNAAINAAESHDQAKTISRPSIVTQNNIKGTVLQGTRIPIQTLINNTITVQYINATLQLDVTPQVTEDGAIFLTIQVQNASPGTFIPGTPGPQIDTQEATTEVLVPDGGTVVFGGVNLAKRTKNATGVPLLGNVPVLGHLFKSNTRDDVDQELLFIVTPKVLQG